MPNRKERGNGSARQVRVAKRAEAEARNKRTLPENRKAARR